MTTIQTFAIPKPQVYEIAKILLTSPMLHIGSQISKLNPYEYVKTSSKIYLPDQEALAKALSQRGKLNEYIKLIEDRQDITSLLKQTFGDDWINTQTKEGEPIFPKIAISNNWVDGKISDLRPMIRNGFNELYIPGSSIKGAIRTAIAYHLLKHSDQYQTPTRISEIETKLREKLNNHTLKKDAKKVGNQLFMEQLFTDFSLCYQGKTYRANNIQNTDFMRAINISDSQPLLLKQLPTTSGKTKKVNIPVTTEVIVSSHFEDGNAKYKAPLYVEMVNQVRTTFTITLDTEMLNWFRHNQGMIIPFNNIQDLFKICQEFAQDQWKHEANYWAEINNNKDRGQNLDFDLLWQNFYGKKTCPYTLRIGWGSGFCGTTINWLINDNLRAEIRDTCGISAPNFEAPKSRRTIKNKQGNIRYVPGWVKMEVK